MADATERKQLEINKLMSKLPHSRLLNLCENVGLDIEEVQTKNKFQLIMLISETIEKGELTDIDELLEKVKQIEKETMAVNKDTIGNKNTETKVKTSQLTDMKERQLYRREFKISGQIGLVTQKDKLSFSSLSHQIETGVKRGYEQSVIVDAVIKAINPSLKLGCYLEGKSSLSLSNLQRILRSHFHEKSPTELYHELSTTSQETKENAQDFLVRLLDLKQKLIFVSQESDSVVMYDPRLTQRMCLHAVQTGLISDFIRSELKDELSNENISEEELIERLNKAERQEEERKAKLKRKPGTIYCVQSETKEIEHNTTNLSAKQKTNLKTEVQALRDEIASFKGMTVELASIKEALSARNTTDRDRSGPDRSFQRRGCYTCKKLEYGNCKHCWNCGGDDHFLSNCPTRPERPAKSGNDKWALSRDRQ